MATAQTGDYLGTLQVSGISLRLVLHIVKDGDAFKATVDSLDQGARGLPVNLTLEGKKIQFANPSMTMRYEGILEGDSISGNFQQNGIQLPLSFKRTDKVEAPKRPQTPQRPFPYNEEEVTVTNGDIRLSGTLSLPKGDGPFPVVIFLTGSGAQDRDETLFEHKPFLVISDALVRMGIATLRMDDRGVGKSTGSLRTTTLPDMAADAVAMFEFLKSRKEVNSKRIGFLGHSEGAMTGPMAAAKLASEAAFVVMLAGPGVTGEELLYEQNASIQSAMGVPEQARAFQTSLQKRFLPLVKSAANNADLEKRIDEEWAKFKEAEPMAKMGEQQILPQLKQQLLTAEMQSIVKHDPAPALSAMKAPVLVLNGTLDTQVPYYQNLPAITALLAKARNPDFTVMALPKLNHLFQTAKSGAPLEYTQIEETVAPRVIDTIAQWLKARIL